MYASSNHVLQHIPHFQPKHHHQQHIAKEPVSVVGIPSISIHNNQLLVGGSQSSSTRSYTILKVLGDGSFGTVWLCDWHGTLPPNTPLSPMQCGAGAKPEWIGKRLVAVKRMKKRWEGGWDECQKLKELESLRAIPFHPNIIPLYDFFLLPVSKELYFVFESMEGNLYHLIKARKGRPLAGGLVSSIFRQIVSGLDHIHKSGYFHRDMKPENVLVTTTGLFNYTSVSPLAPPNASKERDVVAIIKLADFGLARETKSKPPYTEYVSTRWYRAPEVLLLSRDYSNPVDMWALGTIMAELVNLRPLFPGSEQVDQVNKICEILGDPTDEYGSDSHGIPLGGGPWPRGVKRARAIGFRFPKFEPKDIYSLFEPSVPLSLVHCIRDLLRYDPEKRLTSAQCLVHPYLQETTPRNNIPLPSGIKLSSSVPAIPTQPLPSRSLPASHSHNSTYNAFPNTSSTHRTPFQVPGIASHSPAPIITDERRHKPAWSEANGHHPQQTDYPMDISPQNEYPEHYVNGQTVDVHGSPILREYPARPHIEPDLSQDPINGHVVHPQPGTKLGKFGSFTKKRNGWGLGMFGGDKSHHQALPPVDEIPQASTSTPSLKRTQSSSTDSRSLRDPSPGRTQARDTDNIKKTNKKAAERLQREAEKQRHRLAAEMQREQARAVIQKRKQLVASKNLDIEWINPNFHNNSEQVHQVIDKGKQAVTGPIRQNQSNGGNLAGSTTVNAAAGRFATQGESLMRSDREWRNGERFAKARRREFDDDHSMSSSDVHSLSRMSSISFATVDSDPGPARIRNRPSLMGISRMTSMSSLRTSFDDFPSTARSSNSFSLEGQLAHDFRMQANVNSSPLAGNISPPPMQMLSLSPTVSPSLSPSPPWIQVQQHKESMLASQDPTYITIPVQHQQFDYPGQLGLPPSPYGHPPSSYGYAPSPGNTPKSAKSAINPIFKVVSYKWDSADGLVPDYSGDFVQPPLPPSTGTRLSSPNALPPFSQLEAVAGGEYPPLSPMAFVEPSPEDI